MRRASAAVGSRRTAGTANGSAPRRFSAGDGRGRRSSSSTRASTSRISTRKRIAAGVFGGEILAGDDPAGAERHRRLAAQLIHPDIVVFAPSGNALRIGSPTDLTMINGQIVWENGAFTKVDERKLFRDAERALATLDA